jgi:hypothetical protein
MTILEKIDYILNFLKSRQDLSAQFTKEYIWNFYVSRTPELQINSQLYNEIFVTLLDNDLIRENKQEGFPSTYNVTIKGLSFSGFHQAQLQSDRDKANLLLLNKRTLMVNLTIALGTLIAGLYYILEILDKFFHIYPCKK